VEGGLDEEVMRWWSSVMWGGSLVRVYIFVDKDFGWKFITLIYYTQGSLVVVVL
jgi:hypothetical protein